MKFSQFWREYSVARKKLQLDPVREPSLYKLRIFAPNHVTSESRVLELCVLIQKLVKKKAEKIFYAK